MNQKISPQDILAHVSDEIGTTIANLSQTLGVSTRTIQRHLNLLIAQGSIYKKGTPPRVQYYLSTQTINTSTFPIATQRLLEQERYQISQTGEEQQGVQGFQQRCKKRSQDPTTSIQRWQQYIAYIDSLTTPCGIDASTKLQSYPQTKLSHLWYGHIYALPIFGKTKYGTWMEIAKTYPSPTIFQKLSNSILSYVHQLHHTYNIDAVCFASPTAKRTLQIMDYLSKVLLPHLPRIPIQKAAGFFPAQKTLKKLNDRIANARVSFEIQPIKHTYNHVLIIDDAVGSGATIAEIANKLHALGYASHTSGFALIGTANGILEEIKHFEVLTNI